ncbi:alkaline phosphatase family protein [Bacillus aquiflavi]|uniref:Alkaline phosphatase family protein n=1 Tax=Bacillus aquiflavi TaxID=2672567 RepID=A0A6B3VPS7_9BACI|nr:alkaline phosphatase family protein [Bacillus aquiflavi]MBA4535935.1 alkaline phosphatase family protein [Bacillus aquiflavi]NEY80310.1 alkaline phosphatase family protein [Bacillus aquiflavi]
MKNDQKKHVIMLVIDSLMNAPLQQAVNHGHAPALKFFIEHGKLYPAVVSSFPTMSVNIDSTLLTGTYGDIHRLPGLVWFSKEENRLINYGSHVRELLKLGLTRSVKDILIHLNNDHLGKNVKTIHEELAHLGKQSASINTLMYRGNDQYQLKLPKLFTLFKSFNINWPTNGPSLFTYGALSQFSQLKRNNHFWQKYGFNDAFSVQELNYLIHNDLLPEFTIVYLPNLDKDVHKNGPLYIKGVNKVDRQLQKILNTYPSWKEALTENIWIIMGDSGQAPIHAVRKKALIDLRRLLHSYRIMKLKDGVKKEDEIVLGVNERMAFIYSLNPSQLPLQKIAKVLQKDKRIDMIAWKETDFVHVISSVKAGRLNFKPEGKYKDQYEQSWSITGEASILDLLIRNNEVKYNRYPDALARLYSAVISHEGSYLVLSAKPGFEFIGEGSPTHVGGASHGGLHKQDSLVPMIVTGTHSSPKYSRIVDLKAWLLTLINEQV